MHGVHRRQRERKAVLAKVVAHRDLAAERIPAALDVELVQIVRVSLDQHRHVQSRKLQRIGHALDPVFAGLKHPGAAFGVVPRFNGAKLGLLFTNHDRLDLKLVESSQNILPRLGHQPVREEITITNNNRQRCF